jgi:hypothetical protein
VDIGDSRGNVVLSLDNYRYGLGVFDAYGGEPRRYAFLQPWRPYSWANLARWSALRLSSGGILSAFSRCRRFNIVVGDNLFCRASPSGLVVA